MIKNLSTIKKHKFLNSRGRSNKLYSRFLEHQKGQYTHWNNSQAQLNTAEKQSLSLRTLQPLNIIDSCQLKNLTTLRLPMRRVQHIQPIVRNNTVIRTVAQVYVASVA